MDTEKQLQDLYLDYCKKLDISEDIFDALLDEYIYFSESNHKSHIYNSKYIELRDYLLQVEDIFKENAKEANIEPLIFRNIFVNNIDKEN